MMGAIFYKKTFWQSKVSVTLDGRCSRDVTVTDKSRCCYSVIPEDAPMESSLHKDPEAAVEENFPSNYCSVTMTKYGNTVLKTVDALTHIGENVVI